MDEQRAYDAANLAYQECWRNAGGLKKEYAAALKAMELKTPDDVEGFALFVERFVLARTALRESEERTTPLLRQRETAYKALVATGG